MINADGFAGVTTPIDQIRVGERTRTEMGDIDALAESIEAVGLLHPVVITADWLLVAGDRRLAAVRQLGWTEVPVTIVDLDSAADVLRAEADENTCRKALTEVEAARVRERRVTVLAAEAQRRADEGRTRGRAVQAGEPVPAKLAETTGVETRKAAAAGTGYSGSTLDKVDQIRSVAEQGVITFGGAAIPAPEPVKEVAREALAVLEGRDTDAAGPRPRDTSVEHLHRTVAAAIQEHVSPDLQLQRDRLVNGWRSALAGARPFREFDVSTLTDLLGEQDWVRAEPLVAEIEEQCIRFRAARPGQLRVVGGEA